MCDFRVFSGNNCNQANMGLLIITVKKNVIDIIYVLFMRCPTFAAECFFR